MVKDAVHMYSDILICDSVGSVEAPAATRCLCSHSNKALNHMIPLVVQQRSTGEIRELNLNSRILGKKLISGSNLNMLLHFWMLSSKATDTEQATNLSQGEDI